MLFRVTAVIASCLASLALAEGVDSPAERTKIYSDCGFTTECYEVEGCQETAFHATLVGGATGAEAVSLDARVEMRSDSGDVPLRGTMSNGALSLAGAEGFARHLLTINAIGEARYTVHFADGPMMVSYAGTCEAVQ